MIFSVLIFIVFVIEVLVLVYEGKIFFWIVLLELVRNSCVRLVFFGFWEFFKWLFEMLVMGFFKEGWIYNFGLKFLKKKNK